MERSRTITRLRRAGYVAVPLALAALLPPVQARLKAIAVLAESLGGDVPRPFAVEVQRHRTAVAGIEGDLYHPGRPAPGVLVVHGAAPKGPDDPRLVRTATAIAESDRIVFVPALELAERRFVTADLDRIAAAVRGLARHPDVRDRIGVVGISYGGSFALLAATRESVQDDIVQIALFGAYHDLTGVVQAATTGVSLIDGERIPWEADPRARDVLNQVALRLVGRDARRALKAALENDLDPEGLPPAARAVHALVTNTDPTRTFGLASELSANARRVLETFSPSRVASQIRVPVIALHSTDDPTVPYAEALRLRAALPQTDLYTVGLFKHVDVEGSLFSWAAAGDLFTAWRFVGRVLSAQE